ncbi:winged helix-turn-helix domain-containing protein [Trabulsiella odontotermitis]|uniref:winged helix-turn-helix domain-containing protein n=1 Tax=Trabulsiella odontotermitis TaxID=379893 RepID=UPI0006BA277C|nr:winged helix-turn-helix domain-containing protein [Trabulsiella odontotermitis]
MTKGYLINNKIEFWPEDNLLVLYTDQLVNYSLTSPASRCFLFLLQKAPEIVPQNEIYKAVWEEEGIFVPPNTLYQNIASIRRGLKTLSQNDNIIVTVPKKGFQIPPEISIREMTSKDIADQTVFTSSKATPGGENTIKSKRNPLIPLLLIILALSLTLYIYYVQSDTENNFFASYELAEKKDGCIFYHNTNTADINWESELGSTGVILKCNTFPWVYITSYKYTPSLSIIGCNKSIQHKKISCVSIFYREVNNND